MIVITTPTGNTGSKLVKSFYMPERLYALSRSGIVVREPRKQMGWIVQSLDS